MSLWLIWLRCVATLRPACRRGRTFLWLTVVLAGITVRGEHAGITSVVRALALRPAGYHRLLHLFHCQAIDLERLTDLWTHLVLTLFTPLLADGHLVCLADGIKIAKEGKKMPAVRSLHQASESNSKPPFIMGHSLQAVSILVRGSGPHLAAIPLTARIHEGLRWSDRDPRTLLDKLVLLFFSLAKRWSRPVILVADAYYACRKVITPLLERGHHLVSRAKSNTVAYWPPAPTTTRRRGRPRIYGAKVKLKDLAAETLAFVTAPSPVYAEQDVQLRYRCLDLMWRPVGRLVRFVIVHHPHRGTIYLMTTKLDLPPLDVILLYSYRFKIETGFRQAIYVLGSYAYHFWMRDMIPIARRSKDQDLQDKSIQYQQAVARKLKAYHLHVQVACIAQGLMLHLAHHHSERVWQQFRSWLRTMDPTRPPSELVVAYVLRDQLHAFIGCFGACAETAKFIDRYFIQGRARGYEDAA
jgi:hypothetical protein